MSDCGLDGLTFRRPSLVRPQFAADSDLSTIVRRFLKDGTLPEMRSAATIEDATNLPQDFQTLMEQNAEVRQRFEMLPSDVRQKFNNSVDNWLASMIDETGNVGESKADAPASADDSSPQSAEPSAG